jgi:hypothetical protein
MDRVYFIEHRGTRILHVNYSGIQDPEELRGVVRMASSVVRDHPPLSLLVLVDLTGVPHSVVTAAILQQGVAESRPYVRARAVLGLSPFAAMSFDLAAKLFGNPMACFSDATAAKDWLLAHD